MFPTLWKKRELLLSLVKRDLKTRYKSSLLGFFWSVGKPLFLSVIIIFVFKAILRIQLQGSPPPSLSLFILIGILSWFFIIGALQDALSVFLVNQNLIKKIRIEAEVFPAATVVSGLIHFVLALLVYQLIAILYYRVWPSWEIVLLPVVIAIQCLLILGIALLVSALNVYYRDVSSITEIFLSAWFYLTPIIYPLYMAHDAMERLPATLKISPQVTRWVEWVYNLNPMTPIVVAYRRILLYPRFPQAREIVPDSQLLLQLGGSLIFALALFVLGLGVFRKLSPYFSDEL